MAAHYKSRLTEQVEPLLCVNDVAEALRTSRGNVYRLIAAGELSPFRVGQRLRFTATDFRAYLIRAQQVSGDSTDTRKEVNSKDKA